MPCSKPSQSISNLSLIENQIPWIILLSYFHYEKHTYMFICYRFQTCCNIKIYIYCNFGGSYYIFLFEDYLFNSFRQHLFHGKRKGVYFSYLFFDYNALYMYMFPFFQQCKKTARSAISNFTQSYVIWSSHFQEFL